MTTTSPSPTPTGGESGGARMVALPTGRVIAGVVAVAAGVVAVGWPIALMVRPAAVRAVLLGGPMAAAVVGLAVLATRPWKPRKVAAWPMALFGVQGLTLVGVGLVGAGIYTTQHPDPLGFGAAMVAGFVGAWVVVAKVASGPLSPPAPAGG